MGINWGKFFRSAGKVAAKVGLPALETFVPASRPIVEQVKRVVDTHGKQFSPEEFLRAVLPELQPLARFAPEQIPFVLAIVEMALESEKK